MTYNTELLDELSSKLGLLLSFTDYGTNITYTADTKSKKTICAALGYPADTNAQIKDSLNQLELESYLNFTAHTRVVREFELKPFALEFVISQRNADDILSWILTYENGESVSGQLNISETDVMDTVLIDDKPFEKRRAAIQLSAPIGYHHLAFLINGKKPHGNYHIHLIVVPQKCYTPPVFENGARVWGFPLQLYAVDSKRNWGVGDFSDLKNFIPMAKKFGASLIGVNPLNALFSDNPEDASPYCASSRLFLNPIYIDTDAVPEAQNCIPYDEYKQKTDFIETLQRVKESKTVLYTDVTRLKLQALRILFTAFKNVHLDKELKPLTARGQAFVDFCERFGDTLTNFATFQTIRDVRTQQGQGADCWWNWGRNFQEPTGQGVLAFQETYKEEILFVKYVQFIAFEQYAEVGESCRKHKLNVGLYTDLPVGVGHNSAEVWSDKTDFIEGVSAGAPPDAFNKNGQNWSLAAFNPYALKKTGYATYIKVISAVMKNAGAVRIDHAFGLARLFLCVKGAGGAYLTYPFKDLIGIIALESVRHKCLVIAEDLGTAPKGFSSLMREVDALSFGIFHWKRNWEGLMSPPEYDYHSLISSGTHDLPTYTALWQGLDLELAKKMKTITSAQYAQHKEARNTDRKLFVEAFKRQGLLVEETDDIMQGKQVPEWFVPNTYTYLARTLSMLLLVRIEDIVGQIEQINLPGTYLEYPNWRYKLPVLLESLPQDERMVQICEAIGRERPL